MNSEQLKCFLSVSKHLNFTKAAKELYVSQPAISHQISELEAELGTKLFYRSTRNVTLSRAGELFIEDAKKFLDLEVLSKDKLKTLESNQNLVLNIGYLAGPSKPFLPEIINEFHKIYPEVNLQLTRHDAREIKSSLETKQYDIYFSMMEDLIKQKEYQCKKIFSDPYCLVCRQENQCLTENGIDFELLSNEPFIMHAPEKAPYLVKQVLHVCKESNYTPNITNYYKNMEELLFAVESGLGITILPLRLKLYLTTNLVYTPIDVPTCSTIGIAWIDSKDNPSTNWFMDLMSRYF